ncbi:glycerate kinase [Salana multivorans]|uniref:Glycerate kinase n=1 Tax=Salana multivorans TaxID=120377 RepID=A0A3N2DAI9_9MICO|nr:glycerate kinase [Salana multivorans]ROR96810.1 glycerate kinase [Salana multivorans]
MRVVCAPDSFKESMTAAEAAAAMARGVRRALARAVADLDVRTVPMADGGEGTTEAVVDARGGRLVPARVRDALGRPAVGVLGLVDDLAVIEVASAVGLGVIAPADRDPLRASSHGVGDLVRAALDAGVARLLVGLGGSATNDGGAGMVAALGGVLRDATGRAVPASPDHLAGVAALDLSGLDPRLADVEITLACDVTNRLLGPSGATAVFGPQKGVRAGDVALLDAALATWADALEAATGRAVRTLPGSGAAGGLGAAFLALGAARRPGVEVVAEAVGLAAAVAGADLVLTGEGAIDEQTLAGKTPAGVAALALRHGVPVLAFAGRVGPGADLLLERGVARVVGITPDGTPPAVALREGPGNLERAVAAALADRA